MLSDDTRELEPVAPKGTDPAEDYSIEMKRLNDENKESRKKLTDLTILIHQVLEQDEADFFDDNVRTIERQNIRRMLKARFPLTPEMVEIVNKSRETQPPSSTQQSVT